MRVVWRHHADSVSLAPLTPIAGMTGKALRARKPVITIYIRNQCVYTVYSCCVQQETLVNTFHGLIAKGTFFNYLTSVL